MKKEIEMDSSSASLTACLAAAAARLAQIERSAVEANRRASEAIWAHVLDDTICGSEWLANRELLSHQYAPGHQTLYVLYRILNECRPSRILCVGQGAMSQVASQYAHGRKGVELRVTESHGDSPCDLVCVEAGWLVATLPLMKLSEHGTIIIDDAHRTLKNDDIDKYADLIREAGGASVVGSYEGRGMCYVVTGKDNVFLTSM